MVEGRFGRLPPWTRVYVGSVVFAGALTILESLHRIWTDPVPWDWIILAALTLLSGSATVRLPAVPATISVSETFVFTSVLLFGPAAGTLTVALDALVISGWSYKKGHPLYKIIFNVCALPLTIWLASHVFVLIAQIDPLYDTTAAINNTRLLVALLFFTLVYFSLNSWIITFAISLERGLRPLAVWTTHFPWLSLNYFGGASVAWLLVSYTRNLDYTYLVVILPLLIVLYLTFSVSMGRVEDANKHLEQVNTLYMSTIETLAMAIDAKDQITHGHIRRVQTYAVELAKEIGVTDTNLVRAIEAAALLHDMGKLAVPEYILNKPGPLTAAEFEKMKIHASVGADILTAIAFPYPVVPIVRHHHENWDGTGYPDGLAGSDIPIGARLLSVVDCYDALTSDRPYRPRLSNEEAINILRQRRGSMYDPLVVDSFLRLHSRVKHEPAESETKPPLEGMSAVALSQSVSTGRKPLEEITGGADEMQEVFELSRSLAISHHLSEIGTVVLQHTRRLIPYSSGIVYLYDSSSDEFWSAFVVGEHSGLLKNIRIKCGQRLTGWVGANLQTIRNSDPVLDLGDGARALNPRPVSALTVPLNDAEGISGVISLYSTRQNGFSEEQQRVLEILAPHISSAIRRSGGSHAVTNKPSSSLREYADDPQALSPYSSIEIRPGVIFSVITCRMSLDRPSQSNADAVGDELRRVIATLRAHMRIPDVLLQHAPTELILVLPTTGATPVSEIASAIRRDLDRTQEDVLVARPLRWVITMGTSPVDGSTVGDVIRVARARGILPLSDRTSVAEGSAGKAIH